MSEDSVVFQNWVMKRSQMTRVFRRRFTVLTESGKLYSFRKVNLTKPESLLPSNASLSWDIRHAIVEPAPKLGANTWVVKPSQSSALREEVFFRTCSVCPESSCVYWMRVMSAVASQNLSTLFDDVPTLNVTLEIEIPHSSLVYCEFEGSMYPVEAQGSTRISVRSSDPGSCLILKEFSQENFGENHVAESQPIPRYSFYKSRAQIPWSTLRPVKISLVSPRGTEKTGIVYLSINEGLGEYVKPLMTADGPCKPENFDFAIFKFQIRRLIRIIDQIGAFKQRLVDLFEWKDFHVSARWVIYLTIVFLLLPRYLPVILLGHIAHVSLSQSEELTAWWNKQLGLSRPDLVPASPQTISISSPVRATSSSSYPTTNLKEAATNAIQQITSAISNPRGSDSTIMAEIWENQRRTFGGSQFTAGNLSVLDRSRWSDISGRVALDPPSSGDWKIDLEAANSDENGWSYNTRWGASDWHASFTGWDFVRRRCWIPIPRVSRDSGKERFVSSGVNDSNLQQTAYPTSLSGLVTTGAEYGNLQEDYDDTNAEYQPKQSGLGSMFNEFRSTAARAQYEIGEICSAYEKFISIFSWRDQIISTFAICAILMGVVVILVIPLNLAIYIYIMSFFHLGYRRSKWMKVAVDSCLNQHILPLIPENTNPRTLGGLEAHRLCLALNKRTGVNISQKVLADMETTRHIADWICRQSPAFMQYRKWMRRDWVENLLDHIPPEVSIEQQMFFADQYKIRPKPIRIESTPQSDSSELVVEPSASLPENL